MKRILLIMAAMLLLAGLGACKSQTEIVPPEPADPPAETTDMPAEATDTPAADMTLPAPAAGMTRLAAITEDLDGDGTAESVLIDSDDELQTAVTVVSNGASASQTIDYPYAPRLYTVHALWGDASKQIVVSGDTGSDDYTTWIFSYEGGALKSLMLDGYPAELRNDGTLLLSVPVDILGTYGGSVVYTVGRDLTAVRSSDYEIETHEGFAETRTLTVKKDGLTAKTATGETVSLPAGTTLLLQSTNLEDAARCSSSLGEDVILSISPNVDEWGWLIDGVPESEWFDNLMYAG